MSNGNAEEHKEDIVAAAVEEVADKMDKIQLQDEKIIETDLKSAILNENKTIPASEEQPHQNGVNGDGNEVHDNDVNDDVKNVDDCERIKSHIEVNPIEKQNEYSTTSPTSTTNDDDDNEKVEDSNKDNEKDIEVMIGNSEQTLADSDENQVEVQVDAEVMPCSNDFTSNPNESESEIDIENSVSNKQEQQQDILPPPPLPDSLPPSQVSAFVFGVDDDHHDDSNTIAAAEITEAAEEVNDISNNNATNDVASEEEQQNHEMQAADNIVEEESTAEIIEQIQVEKEIEMEVEESQSEEAEKEIETVVSMQVEERQSEQEDEGNETTSVSPSSELLNENMPNNTEMSKDQLAALQAAEVIDEITKTAVEIVQQRLESSANNNTFVIENDNQNNITENEQTVVQISQNKQTPSICIDFENNEEPQDNEEDKDCNITTTALNSTDLIIDNNAKTQTITEDSLKNTIQVNTSF